jgi:very-short-patch-repair endonuclease
VELDRAQHLSDPVAHRRDRRKDQLLQENGYFVLRFLAEDVGTELDAVLASGATPRKVLGAPRVLHVEAMKAWQPVPRRA